MKKIIEVSRFVKDNNIIGYQRKIFDTKKRRTYAEWSTDNKTWQPFDVSIACSFPHKYDLHEYGVKVGRVWRFEGDRIKVYINGKYIKQLIGFNSPDDKDYVGILVLNTEGYFYIKTEFRNVPFISVLFSRSLESTRTKYPSLERCRYLGNIHEDTRK